ALYLTTTSPSANIAKFTGGATPTVEIFNSLQLDALLSAACLGTNSGGTVISSTCTALSFSAPLSLSGTTVSCTTCMVTTGGQTVNGSDTWSAVQTYTANILAS